MGDGDHQHCCPWAPVLVSIILHLLIPGMANPARPCCHNTPGNGASGWVAGLPSKLNSTRCASAYVLCVMAHWRMLCWFGVIANHLQPRPTKPPTQRSSVIPSGIVVCHYHEGGECNRTIVLVVAWVEGIGPVLPILEGAAVYAPLSLGYTDCSSSIGSFCWGREVKPYTLPPSSLCCLTYPTDLQVLGPLGLTTQQSHHLYAICLYFLPHTAQMSPFWLCCQIGIQTVHPLDERGDWCELY